MEHPVAFGALDRKVDYRDVPAESVLPQGIPLPSAYQPPYLRGTFDMPNQKLIGSCGGHASVKYKKIQEWKETQENPDLSYRWAYAHAWQRNKPYYTGQGSNSSDLMWVIRNIGVGLASDFPNNNDLSHAEYVDTSAITADAYARAAEYCSGGYAWVDFTNPDALKSAIYSTGGVMVAINLGSEWWTPSYAKADIDPIRTPKSIVSGHFIVLDSWDTTLSGDTAFKGTVFGFPNSWGPEWADGGRNEMVYSDYSPFIKDAVCMTDLPDDWLQKLKDTPPADNFKYKFTTNLSQSVLHGQYSEDVKNLQIALWIDGEFPKDVPLSEYGYYGEKTRKAVLAFQIKHNVASPQELMSLNGTFVGVKTRSCLNRMFN